MLESPSNEHNRDYSLTVSCDNDYANSEIFEMMLDGKQCNSVIMYGCKRQHSSTKTNSYLIKKN